MCDIVGCEQRPVFYDEMGNEMCQDCVDRAIEDEGAEPEDFERIAIHIN